MLYEKFIQKARKVHGNKYEYFRFDDLPSKEKVCIVCPEHGKFLQSLSKHLSGQGCPKCSSPNRGITHDEYIEKATAKHNGKYKYDNVIFKTLQDKITITCPIHGDFEQSAKEHLNGQGCPQCKYNTIASKRRMSTEEFIEKARKIHGDKYDYSKVEYVNTNTPVCIICPIHGEFWQTPGDHLIGHGCLKCSGKYRYSTEEFIEELKKCYGDRYDYSKVEYVNAKTKVCLICPIHGEFWMLPSVLLRGAECLKCSYDKRGKGLALSKEKFIEKSTKKHGDKYDYSKVIYVNNNTPVCIICSIHGEFWQTPASHLNGSGCPKCSPNRNWKYTTDEWVQSARNVHGDKYDYSKVEYVNCNTPVCIICPEHGEFWQTPSKHLAGAGCPSCNNSKLENEVFNLLRNNNIDFTREYREKSFGRLRCDFFIKDMGLVIECQGEQHFKETKFGNETDEETSARFIKQLDNDLLKKKLVEKMGYDIIYYTLYKNMENKPLTNPVFNGIYTKKNLINGKTALTKEILRRLP